MIPPEHDGEYVARMEDVLGVYEREYDPSAPVVCMDEKSVQLLKEIRQSIAAAPGRPQRIDYEYERNGTANMELEDCVKTRESLIAERLETREMRAGEIRARMRRGVGRPM